MNEPSTERAGGPADCHRCFNEATTEGSLERLFRRMIVCSTCGNKRCPKATDHRHDCTGSNEPGQAGSAYGVQSWASGAAS